MKKQMLLMLIVAGMLIGAGGCNSMFVSCESHRKSYVDNHPYIGQHDFTCMPLGGYIPCENYPNSPCKRESVRKRYEKTNERISSGHITTGFTVEQVEASWCCQLRLVRSSRGRYGRRDMYSNGSYYFHFDIGSDAPGGSLTSTTYYGR